MSEPLARELHDLYRDAPKNADAMQAIAWMRKTIRPQAAQEAVMHVLGEADNPPYAESLMLVAALAKRMAWPGQWASTALQAEWKEAQAHAASVLEAAEKVTRRLVFEAAPGSRVIEAATQVFGRANLYLSSDAIRALCARVAQGGSRGARRVGHR